MKQVCTLMVLLLGVGIALAQSETRTATAPYSLKGFKLGESSLADFKAQFRHCADSCDAKSKYTPKFAPFCSDDFPESRQTPDHADSALPWTKSGLVFCQPYFPFERDKHFTIADVDTTAYFDFFNGKLYRISAAFLNYGGTNFASMRDAFISKFGPATKDDVVEYNNAFGVKFSGHVLTWDNGVSTIVLTEINQSKDTSAVVFSHKAILNAAGEAAPKKTTHDL